MKRHSNLQTRLSLFAIAGLLSIVLDAAHVTPASAQASDAADRCTPDVMRLCQEFVPDADRIVACLKAKRRQLSPECHSALTGGGAKSTGGHRRHKKAG